MSGWLLRARGPQLARVDTPRGGRLTGRSASPRGRGGRIEERPPEPGARDADLPTDQSEAGGPGLLECEIRHQLASVPRSASEPVASLDLAIEKITT